MQLEELSQRFKALSDPIRLRIVQLLLTKDSYCVCELVDILDLSQSTVSRHLAYLKNSHLVESWREGVWMHYKLKSENLSFINMADLQTLLDELNPVEIDECRDSKC